MVKNVKSFLQLINFNKFKKKKKLFGILMKNINEINFNLYIQPPFKQKQKKNKARVS